MKMTEVQEVLIISQLIVPIQPMQQKRINTLKSIYDHSSNSGGMFRKA